MSKSNAARMSQMMSIFVPGCPLSIIDSLFWTVPALSASSVCVMPFMVRRRRIMSPIWPDVLTVCLMGSSMGHLSFIWDISLHDNHSIIKQSDRNNKQGAHQHAEASYWRSPNQLGAAPSSNWQDMRRPLLPVMKTDILKYIHPGVRHGSDCQAISERQKPSGAFAA